jgi:hypothetical protein
MPPKRSLRIPADILHRVSLPRWLALLDAFGRPRGLPKNARVEDIAKVARAGALSARAVDAVHVLRALSPVAARDAIFEGAADREADLSAWPKGDGPLDDAAHLIAEHANDEAGIVERALLRIARDAPTRPYRLYLASRALGAGAFTAANVARFSKLVATALEARGAGEHVRAELSTDPAAPDWIALECVRSERTATPFALVEGARGATEGRVAYTPLAADVIRLDARRERLSVGTSARWLATVYRRAFGLAFYGDEGAFSSKASCSLDRILRFGAEALKVPGFAATIRQVRVVRIRWDSGGYDTMERAGRDVLDSLVQCGHHLQGGELVGVTLRFNFVDGDVADVELRLPNRVHWSPSRHDATIFAWLDAAHVTGGDSLPHDLLSLAPHDRPRSVWVRAFGEALVATAIRDGLLVKSEARAVVHPEHPDGARDLVVFRTKTGDAWGIPDDTDDEVGARTLDDAHLETFKLDAMAATTRLAKNAGLSGTPCAIAGRPGVVDAGQLVVGPTSVRAFVAFAEPSPLGLVDDLRTRALPGHAVLLVPPGRRLAVDIAQVEVEVLGAGGRDLPRAMVHAVKLTAFVDVWLGAPEGTRVAVDVKGREVWFDGVRLKLSELLFVLVSLLAEAHGAVVATKVLDKKLGGANSAGTTKDVKRRLVDAVKHAFEAAGRVAPADVGDIVVSEAGGYRLAMRCFVR